MAMREDKTYMTIQRLCRSVMEGKWVEVVKIYTEHREKSVQGAAITFSGDTALHMAVYANELTTVQSLIDVLVDDVNLVDDKGNTPLHHAAKIGHEKMCVRIALSKPDLLARRNTDGETPFLVAALHGHEEAFNIFRIICFGYGYLDNFPAYCRRNSDGRTALHCCIDGEYFEFAFQILRRFPEFLHAVDHQGNSPLHILASKDSAFKSSSSLTWWGNVLYRLIPAEKQRVNDDKYGALANGIFNSIPAEKPTVNDNIYRELAKGILESLGQWEERDTDRATKKNSTRVKLTKNLFPKHLVDMKQKHKWPLLIQWIMVEIAKGYDYKSDGGCPATVEETSFSNENMQSDKSHIQKYQASETPILIAAKNGISELVESILGRFPVAIHDVNSEGKNLMLLAVENRQPHIFEMLRKYEKFGSTLLNCVDNNGNNALHHAAMLKTHPAWAAPDAVLQMQWELKWYEYIEDVVPKHLSACRNAEGKNPKEIFMETHSDLAINDKEWLMKTSESCTLVATLIATVAFGTSASLPGDIKSRTTMNSQEALMLKVFGIASLLALFFSLTATIMFLSILTSRHQPTDFRKGLPLKLQFGLAALFMSFPSMLTCFCGGHFFILKDVLHNVKASKIAEFLAVLVPVSVFAIAQFPLYFKLMLATIFKRVPERAFMIINTIQDSRSRPREAMQPPEYWRVTSVKEQALVAGSPSPASNGGGALLLSPVPQNELLDLMKTASSSFNAS